MGSSRMADDVDVDLGHLLGSLKRKWWLVLGVSLAVGAGVFVLSISATPLYRAETRVLIETRESIFTRPDGSAAAEVGALDTESVASQVEVIGSSQLLLDVARQLDLVSLEEFAPQPSTTRQVLIFLGLANELDETATDEAVLRAMRDKLEVYRVENSRVIVIGFSSENPALAASVPNAVADAYVAAQRAAKMESNESATEWLAPEIEDLRERVREAEGKVAAFRAESDLLLGQNNTVLASQQLSELSSELSRVRANRSAAEARARTVRLALQNGASVEALAEVQASALFQRLRERQVEMRAQIADLSTSLMSNHPRIRALQSQLADLNSEISAEARRILAALEAEADSARQREQELSADLEQQKEEVARAEEAQVELRALERQAASERALLDSYVTRFREAAARLDRNYLPVDARIFSRAFPPSNPYYPKPVPMMLAALAGTMLLMAVLVLLQELFSGRALRPVSVTEEDDAVRAEPQRSEPEAEPVQSVTPPPVAAAAPIPPTTATMPPSEVDVKAAARALAAGGASRGIFVSPEGDEAAAVAVLVAREVADSGRRVLLLDLTITGAASLPMLESLSYPGITNLLTSEAQFAEVIHSDHYSSCHIIPIGTADPEKTMESIDRLPIIMESLTAAYDLVVVECGPTTATSIVRLLEGDAKVLVSVINRDDESVSEMVAELDEEGLEAPLVMSPVDYVPPAAPTDRDAA